ncbi:MAG: cobalamin biosynthesis protein CbiD [Mycobacterium sp.]|nr:cobalamin biosynthesis protein CbiD [Mycobacterium sp.]
MTSPGAPAEPGPPAGPGGASVPAVREPDLPRTMKVRPNALRFGWTTGTCAAAAARAAAVALTTGAVPERTECALPDGQRPSFPVADGGVGDGTAWAAVVKDAGDDPDVTHGAVLTVTLTPRAEPGVGFAAGDGVGTVTKPGLGLEVGGPAINPVPRQMIAQALGEVLDLDARGVLATVSVPGGEKMARKTTNARLGILGGISILGTTGIVRPFSTAAWRASVVQAVSVQAAQGGDTIVLCTGGRTEKGAMRLLPQLPEGAFVEVGDFTGAAVHEAVAKGLSRVVFVGMAGKLAKLAGGVVMTHYTRSKVPTAMLGELTTEAGGDPAVAAEVAAAVTARRAYELWETTGLLGAAGRLLCDRVRAVLASLAEADGAPDLRVEVAMVDFAGDRCVATSAGWAA